MATNAIDQAIERAVSAPHIPDPGRKPGRPKSAHSITPPRGKGPPRQLYTYRGRTTNLKQHAREQGVPFSRLFSRIRSGWSIEAAIETPSKISERTKALAEMAEEGD